MLFTMAIMRLNSTFVMRSFNALNVLRSLPLTEVINVAAVTITVVRVIELKMVCAYLGWHVACLD